MQIKVTTGHYSMSPFTDWAAYIGDEEDQITGYGRTAIEALEDLKHNVCDDEALVEAVERRIEITRRQRTENILKNKRRA